MQTELSKAYLRNSQLTWSKLSTVGGLKIHFHLNKLYSYLTQHIYLISAPSLPKLTVKINNCE